MDTEKEKDMMNEKYDYDSFKKINKALEIAEQEAAKFEEDLGIAAVTAIMAWAKYCITKKVSETKELGEEVTGFFHAQANDYFRIYRAWEEQVQQEEAISLVLETATAIHLEALEKSGANDYLERKGEHLVVPGENGERLKFNLPLKPKEFNQVAEHFSDFIVEKLKEKSQAAKDKVNPIEMHLTEDDHRPDTERVRKFRDTLFDKRGIPHTANVYTDNLGNDADLCAEVSIEKVARYTLLNCRIPRSGCTVEGNVVIWRKIGYEDSYLENEIYRDLVGESEESHDAQLQYAQELFSCIAISVLVMFNPDLASCEDREHGLTYQQMLRPVTCVAYNLIEAIVQNLIARGYKPTLAEEDSDQLVGGVMVDGRVLNAIVKRKRLER